MKKYTRECFGSFLNITIESEKNLDSVMSEAFSLLESFENEYSRFIQWNTLSKLNAEKTWILPDEIMQLIHLCKKVSSLTQWYYDITVLPVLENNGYWIETTVLEDTLGYESIICDGNTITLKNDVSIEFGSFGKLYAIDLLYNCLNQYSDDFTINFGGDIRIAGKKTIHLEDPSDDTKNIWIIELKNASIASSGWNKRVINVWHHLINPKEKVSQNDKKAVYVTHKLWIMADIFATALFVCPLKLALGVLEKTPGLEALIIWADGKMYKSKWFNCNLTI